MSAYLKFFSFERSPFEGEAASKVVLGTRALRDALAAIEEGLTENAARICVSGESGLGKTSLARALPKLLGKERAVSVIPDPDSGWDAIRTRIEKQWRLPARGLSRSALLQARQSKQLVLVLDQAERASEDLLDHLDVLLSYHDDDERPLVQCVLFAALSADTSASPPPLVWWLDRIQTHQLAFKPLRPEGVASYIEKHLARAGWSGTALFQADAAEAIHGYTGGIPGEVGRVCQELLEAAAENDQATIDAAFVHEQLDASLAGDDTICESQFEELIAEEEFDGASPEEPTDSSEASEASEAEEVAALLDETLARFASTPAGTPTAPQAPPASAGNSIADGLFPGEPDVLEQAFGNRSLEDGSAAGDLDAYLSRPATDAELRAIQGGWKRPLAIAAGVLLALAIVGGGIASLLGSDDEDPVPNGSAAIPVRPKPVLSVPADKPNAAPARLQNGQVPQDLARLKGPIPQQNPSKRAPLSPPATSQAVKQILGAPPAAPAPANP